MHYFTLDYIAIGGVFSRVPPIGSDWEWDIETEFDILLSPLYFLLEKGNAPKAKFEPTISGLPIRHSSHSATNALL